ncbi:MAG TPA: choice-of-anchor X domain-containing protein [bacterium]|nr:choice-of-anchor X domain-containing protein [bacterium]
MRNVFFNVLCLGLVMLLCGLSGGAFAQEQPNVFIYVLNPLTAREEPDENGDFLIEWLDGDFGYISLFRDSDNQEGGETLITPFPLPALDFKDLTWNTNNLPNLTEWYIVGKIRLSLDENEPWIQTSYSLGTIYINRVTEPVIHVGPDADVTADRGITLPFQLRGVGYYWLFYDVDREPGGEGQIMGPSDPFMYVDYAPGIYEWDTSDLPDGQSYYIVGKTKMNLLDANWSYSEASLGRVTIDHTQHYEINVQEPGGSVYLPVGETFTVEWDDQDPNVSAYVLIYTDTDIDGDPSDDVRRSLLPITVSDRQNQFTMAFTDLSDQPGNTYYVIARIKESSQDDGGETLAEGFSDGTITLYNKSTQDTTPPAAVQNLRAEPRGDGSTITLKWTAPGDDGNYGTASSYDIRYSTSIFESDSDFQSGTSVPYVDQKTGNKPLRSGSPQRLDVGGLDLATVYYFALKTTDDSGQTSPMSNIAWTDSMPVVLSSFEAVPGFERITLNWTTASETDALGWHVARRDDAKGIFHTITSQMVRAAGTSSEPHSYTYTDADVSSGITYYYKLLLYNLDGSKEESKIVSCSPFAAPSGPTSDSYPLILGGGFVGSVVNSSTGGSLTVMAIVDPYTGSGEIEKVELSYKGIPTGILLYDDGTHGDDVAGDNTFHNTIDVEPGLAAGNYVLEIVATDTDGNQSPVFPYVTVR